MRFVAMVPDPVTGRLVPYCSEAGIALTFEARDQQHAHAMAKADRLPPAVLVLPDELLGSSPGRRAKTPAETPMIRSTNHKHLPTRGG